MPTNIDLLSEGKTIHQDLINIRRHIHKNPELSWQEKETSSFIQAQLDEIGVSYTTGWGGGTGVIAELGNGDKTVALRADMDALPIEEKAAHAYKSQKQGVMHACGHDVHTTCLLGALRILKKFEAHLSHRVVAIFQPAEEQLPGGASIILKEGFIEKYNPVAIIGLHVHPPLEVGKVGLSPGQYMASADEIRITVKGKGGHAAVPQDCIDPIIMAAQLLILFQQLVSRKSNPINPAVLSFGKINSIGGATNVIPNEVKLEGTLRAMDEVWRKEAHDWIRNTASNYAKSQDAEIDVDIAIGYPCLLNDEQLTHNAKARLQDLLGAENVVDLPKRMTAEDFAYYSQEIPACFYRLGVRNEAKGITSSVHTDTFDVDEECLCIGASTLAHIALNI